MLLSCIRYHESEVLKKVELYIYLLVQQFSGMAVHHRPMSTSDWAEFLKANSSTRRFVPPLDTSLFSEHLRTCTSLIAQNSLILVREARHDLAANFNCFQNAANSMSVVTGRTERLIKSPTPMRELHHIVPYPPTNAYTPSLTYSKSYPAAIPSPEAPT